MIPTATPAKSMSTGPFRLRDGLAVVDTASLSHRSPRNAKHQQIPANCAACQRVTQPYCALLPRQMAISTHVSHAVRDLLCFETHVLVIWQFGTFAATFKVDSLARFGNVTVFSRLRRVIGFTRCKHVNPIRRRRPRHDGRRHGSGQRTTHP